MDNYFVRKTGNDTTGDGSDALPWLTVQKAADTISAAGGHTVNIGTGVYSEGNGGTHYLLLNVLYTNPVVFQSDGSGPVTITDDGTLHTFMARFRLCKNVTFQGIDFVGNTYKSNGVVYLDDYASSNISLINCSITFTTNATLSYGFFLSTTTNAITGVVLQNVTINQLGTDTCYAIRMVKSTAGAAHGITFTNCIVNTRGTALWVDGYTDAAVNGGVFASSVGYGIIYGLDASSGGRTVTGSVKNASVSSVSSHALLIGNGCSNVTVDNNAVVGGDHGIAVKENVGSVVTNNRITAGTLQGLYFKAATNVTATGNIIAGVGANVVKANDGDTGNHPGNINFQHNTVRGTGSSGLFSWTSNDSGGSVCDYNIYDPLGSAKFGIVRANNSVADLVALRAAWAGYGDGSNDSHSSLYAPDSSGTGDGCDGLLLLFRHHR